MQKKGFLLLLLVMLAAAYTQAQQLKWTEVAPGVWRGIIGKAEAYNLLKAAGTKPQLPALARMPKASFPLDPADISGTLRDGKTALRLPLQKEEQVYGFGLHFQTVH